MYTPHYSEDAPSPEDIARLARFLLSDSANYITGQVLNANGGAIR